MTEDEAKSFPIGGKVKIVVKEHSGAGKIVEVVKYDAFQGVWRVETDNGSSWLNARSIELVEAKSDVDSWFDDCLSGKSEVKKERVPDEIDWEKHEQFMRGL